MESPVTPPPPSRGSRWNAIIPGLILIALGVWFLLQNLGVINLDLARIWPVFPTVFGLAMLLVALVNRRGRARAEGEVMVGVWALLLGLFFFLFSTGTVSWDDLARLWPTFPLIVGLGFLLGFLAGGARDWGVFIVGAITVLVGVVGYLFTFGVFTASFAAATLPYAVPVLLILGGLGFLLSAARRR